MPLEPLEVEWGGIHWLLRSFLETEDPVLRAAYLSALNKNHLEDDKDLRTTLQRIGPSTFLQCMDAGRSLKEIRKLGIHPEVDAQSWQEMLLPADSLFMRIYGIAPSSKIEHDVKNDFAALLLRQLQHDLEQGTSPAEFLKDLTQRLGEIPAGQNLQYLTKRCMDKPRSRLVAEFWNPTGACSRYGTFVIMAGT